MNKHENGIAAFIAIIVVILLIGIGGWWVYSRRHVAVATCDAASLQAGLGTTDGTAGTLYQHVTVKNSGQKNCTLTGYPSVFLLDSHNAVMAGAEANALYAPVLLTLHSGDTIHTVVAFPEAGNFSGGVCTAMSTTLELVLPGSTQSIQKPAAKQACPGFSATAFQSGS